MPGFVCTVSFDAPVNAIDLDAAKLANAIDGGIGCCRSEFDSPHARMVCNGRSAHSGIASNADGITLGVYGTLADGLQHTQSAAPRLLAAFEKDGIAAIEKLNGRFVVTIWDARANCLTVVTDILGLQRAYMWRWGNTIAIATRQEALFAFPEFRRNLDEGAIVELLRCGFLVGNSSLFGGVRHVPSASVTEIAAETTNERTYWRMPFGDGVTPLMSNDEYADEMVRLIRQAVRRTTDSNSAIALSSGHDSRAIAAAAADETDPRRLRCATIAPEDSLETIYARQISELLRIPFTHVEMPEDFFARYAVEGVHRTEGGMILHTCWRMAMDDFLRSVMPGSIQNGFMGDILQSYSMTRVLFDERDPELGWECYRLRYPKPIISDRLMRSLFKPALAEIGVGPLYEKIHRGYDSVDAPLAVQRLDYIVAQFHDRRFYSVQSDYSDWAAPVQFPFVDRDLYEFAVGLPVSCRQEPEVYLRAIAKLNAEVAEIPTAGSDMPVDAPLAVRWYHRMAGRLRYAGMPGLRKGPSRGAYIRYLPWLRGANRAFVESTLAQTEYLEDYFNIDCLKKITDDVLDGRSNDYGRIYNLAGFVLFRKWIASL